MNLKNLKVYKKLLTLINAGILGLTPVVGNASETETSYIDTVVPTPAAQPTPFQTDYDYETFETVSDNFALVSQEKFIEPLTIGELTNEMGMIYNYLTKYINYDHLQEDLQSAYYLVNRTYMDEDLENTLIDGKIVYETTEDNLQNFMNAFRLFNVIADYNQSTIRNGCSCGRYDLETLIDVSTFCHDEHDKELVHDMHVNYFNAYRSGRFPTEDYTKVFKQLTTLNACEQNGNAFEISTGAMWLSQHVIGGCVMQMLRDDMQEDYVREELDKYFIKEELNRGQWFLRDDVSLDLNCLSDLEYEVFNFGELWHFCYDTVNIDMLTSFGIDLYNKTK